MVALKRGEIWWIRQPADTRQSADASTGKRPYLVVSSDSWNLVLEYPRVTVCPLTSIDNVPRRYDTDVVLRKRDTRLPKDSVARCTEIYTVFRSVMLERVSRIPDERLVEVEKALGLYLALEGN